MLEKNETTMNVSGNKMTMIIIMMIWALCFLMALLLSSTVAHAQMNNQSWQFKQQNRASLAALMKQVEDSEDQAVVAAAPVSYDTLICGSDAQSTAKGNSTCIIMNNADGMIEIGQDAQGSQTASTTENSQTETEESMSDVLEDLEND